LLRHVPKSPNSGHASYGRVRFITDHTDDPVIPQSGYRVETNFRAFDHYPSATETIPALDARVEFFQPISRTGSVVLIGTGGTTFGRNESGILLYFLGGVSTLSAYGSNEVGGNQFYLFRAGYLRDIFTLPPFVGKKVYAVAYYDFGKMYGDINESKFPNDVAAGVVAETFVGPLLIGGSVGDRRVVSRFPKGFDAFSIGSDIWTLCAARGVLSAALLD
jgi:NTE family protein